MDNLETPYDEETEFIECTVCDKSLRGSTLYKIHLTTPGHIKKEDVFVASGLAIRRQTIPEFKDITQYLDYLKLDEPIIGLSFLEEVPSNDPLGGPKYLCRLCNQTTILAEMVCHVIGRKHRQRYVEVKRPDLVTWDKQTQAGKIIRTRAEIIERQDGRGTPRPMAKKGIEGKLNISRVPPNQKQNRDRRIPQTVQDVPPLLPELKDYHRRKQLTGYPNPSTFHRDEPYMNRDRRSEREDTLSHDRIEEELFRENYNENRMYRDDYVDSDYRSQYKEEYVEDPPKSVVFEPNEVPGYDYREKVPHGQVQHGEYYPGEASPYKRPYPERDPLKEFFSEEVRRGQVRSAAYSPSELAYPEDNKRQWSLERDSGRPGSSEPEAKRRNFSTPMESERSRDHLFNIIRDYHHEMKPHEAEILDNPGPSRARAPSTQRRVEVTRTISDIPEPFRRFLKGGNDDEGHGKRKRKSRFSDATPEELEMTKEMFSDKHGPPNPNYSDNRSSLDVPLRPEISGTQYADLYRELQSPHHTESYHRGGSESEGVFDMLKNIEIENAEEADFLKNKLCNLLKEFKTKKSEKAVQNSQSRPGISRNYSDPNMDPQLPRRHLYERTLREDSDHRPEDLDFSDDHRRGWKQREHLAEERHQDYHPPVHGEPRHSTRGRYEDVYGTPHINPLDEPPRYPDRFQEPMRPRDYQPAAEEFFDSDPSAPPLHMEQGSRMHRGHRYSSKMDKITSTLLELVARK
ncbi:uncharacterized protein si:ch211-13c6.2 isoform X1 [Amphiprion ocellaris]|uniref:C2H2-type domain-containing protein n=2 Tax=Amphiprion ocellaris TaxID=80972 RepID=A0A3Q1AI92_AMPOC|nr:uncharacterized protein si:ch211-13c6.2 isoform X1 [Amphiprion ocellaris]